MQDGQNGTDEALPKTPESPLTSNLHNASATIDDLTLALANFSRIPSPEPPSAFMCCCGKDDCGNTKAWLTFKSNLESRLILSAEVGQALLQRHEAYVRKQEEHHTWARSESSQDAKVESQDHVYASQDQADSLADDLMKEKAALEKRLNQALVNNEVAEVTNKTLLHELQEARVAISRLTAHYVRSVGWDARLMAVMQERDDMQQERDSEIHKARQAEVRIAALNARVSKLQLEIQHLQEGVEQRRLHRLESSESILQDARVRLEVLQNSQLGHTAMTEETEIMKVLESLVEDNEAFKCDNAELQRLLAESREDYHILQEEVEEQRANPPSHTGTPHFKSFFLTPGNLASLTRPNTTTEGKSRRNFEPSTPDADRRLLSPSNSLTPSEPNSTAFSHAQSHDPTSDVGIEEESQHCLTLEKLQPHKPPFLLGRSRGVQTDVWSGALAPYTLPTHLRSPSPHDPRSESSSMTDSQPSNMTILVEHVVSLLNRMTQADALTLMNRLKRQNLKGADLGHLSRVTVGGIVSDASNLRTPFRALLEDDKVTTTWTRKDLRGLFKLFKDTFVEMGNLRIMLNDVILDPSVSGKLRDQALNPSKGEMAAPGLPTSGGWMAPISKLFGSSGGEGNVADKDLSSLGPEEKRGRAKSRPPHRVIPKLGPALSASTTTVNVEFSGTGVGRAVTSTIKAREGEATVGLPNTSLDGSSHHTSANVMGIFAGAPSSSTPDPWVVLPKAPVTAVRPVHAARPVLSPKKGDNINQRSRNVDAVIDVSSSNDHESDTLAPLLQRTLRRRGLSDSSIHSTLMSQADESRLLPHTVIRDGPSAREVRPDRGSVLKALSRTVQNFKLTPSGSQTITSNINGSRGHSSGSAVPSTSSSPPNPRVSPLVALLPNMSSWGSSAGLDPSSEPFYVGSGREEPLIHQVRGHGGRDYF